MDKPRRLAAILMALMEADTLAEYAQKRDEIFNALPDSTDEIAKTVYDDLRFVFKAPTKKPINISPRTDPGEMLTGDFRSNEFNPYG